MALLSDPKARHWGYDLSKKAGVRSGVLYPLLTRMLADGYLSDGWEDPADTGGKRPPRRYYEVTPLGLRELGAVLQQAKSDSRFKSLDWSGLQVAW